MTLEEYTALSGVTVSTNNEAKVTAQIARTKRILETLLGYSLDPDLTEGEETISPRLTNLYTELGQTDLDCSCSDISLQDLDPADEVEYAYRLFSYNSDDKYLWVDPFTALNKVKLVKDGVTYKTFDPEEIRVDYGLNNLTKFIEVCDGCGCYTDCTKDCLQLAIDADWCFESLPDDLLQVWADMVTFYSNDNWNVKSQSVLGHNYTMADNRPPQEYDYNLAVINRYAGPYGTVGKIPT